MYVMECDVAWGSHANMYLGNKYVYIYVLLQPQNKYLYNNTCTILSFSSYNGFNR
jgi:hypothetical protein